MTRPFYIIGILMLVMLPVRSIAQTQRPARANDTGSSTSGSITGKVVNENGQPLPEAYVYVEAVGRPGRSSPTTSDRNGVFKLEGLTPGSYRVVATLAAYTPKPREPENAPVPQYQIGDSVTLVMIRGGVITGTVTATNGEPVVSVPVVARLVRDRSGRRLPGADVREVVTDDRGVYRIYGLPPGIYIVGTNSANDYSQTGVNAFANDVPTYAPSSTRDTAEEINVRAGEEVGNVDIRYRGERGRSITGTVVENAAVDSGFVVVLSPATPGVQDWSTHANQQANRAFAFDGVSDGDYYVTAMLHFEDGDRAISESKLVNVRGADVTGLELTTVPMGNISGRVVAEETRAAECAEKTPLPFSETSVSAWHKDTEASKKRPQFVWSMGAPATPNDKGTFKLRTLAPSQYYFQARVQAQHWYLKSITMGSAKPVDVTRLWTNVKSGDQLSGLTVTFAQGAASFSGKLVLAEGQTVPEKLFIYLAPVEPGRADEPLSFFGGPVTPEGKVSLNNLAPGRYWLLPQVVMEETPSPLARVRLPDATRLRAKLRSEAEAGKTEIQLKPCQKIADFEVTLK